MKTAKGVPAQEFIRRLSKEDHLQLLQWVRNLARRKGLDVGEADDLYQEALLRLLRGNRIIDSESGFRAYLAVTVRSVAFDALRRRHMETRHGRVELSREVAEQVPAEVGEYAHEDVSRLLTTLTEREREVARLTLQGLSPNEIGKQLKIQPSTVRSLLRRIRAHFALIGEEGK